MFIPRDFNRTEEDDYKLSVLDRLNESTESIEVMDYNDVLIGWRIQVRFE